MAKEDDLTTAKMRHELKALTAVVLLLLVAWVSYYLFAKTFPTAPAPNPALDKEVTTLLKDYNVPLTVSNCTSTTIGPICDTYSDINIPDKNTNIKLQAVAKVAFIKEKNALIMVKIDPYFGDTNLKYEKIPADVKKALSNITVLVTDNMVCLPTSNDQNMECYIATNMAKLGNGELFYAPLFKIVRDENGAIDRVIVYV